MQLTNTKVVPLLTHEEKIFVDLAAKIFVRTCIKKVNERNKIDPISKDKHRKAKQF